MVDGARVGGGVSRVGCHRCNLLVPSCEGVGVLRIGRFGGFGASRCCAVVPQSAVKDSTVFVLEGDGILVDGAGISRRVSSISSYRCYLFVPTCEGVGVLCIGRFDGCGSVVFGHNAV